MSENWLSIEQMDERHPGLTQVVAAYYAQAARICVDRHHTPPQELTIETRGRQSVHSINWEVTDDATKAAWNNTDDATRDAAYAVAIAAVEQHEGLVAIHRAQTRTGADYFLAPRGTPRGELENSYRLEISGVDKGDAKVITARLYQKMDQTRRGESDRPALAAVVGFKTALVMFEHVDAE